MVVVMVVVVMAVAVRAVAMVVVRVAAETEAEMAAAETHQLDSATSTEIKHGPRAPRSCSRKRSAWWW